MMVVQQFREGLDGRLFPRPTVEQNRAMIAEATGNDVVLERVVVDGKAMYRAKCFWMTETISAVGPDADHAIRKLRVKLFKFFNSGDDVDLAVSFFD